MVLIVVALGVVYALPNIYPPDFAVQISNQNADGQFTQQALDAATARLTEDDVGFFGAELGDNNGLIRFFDDVSQLKARDLIQLALHELEDDYVVALNAAATTPGWLVAIGGAPMKYGLDLRGGVHFLMEVDTDSAIAERVAGIEQDIKRFFRQRDDRIRYTGFSSPSVFQFTRESAQQGSYPGPTYGYTQPPPLPGRLQRGEGTGPGARPSPVWPGSSSDHSLEREGAIIQEQWRSS